MSKVHSLAVEYRDRADRLSKTVEGHSAEGVRECIAELYDSFGSPRQKANLLEKVLAPRSVSVWPAEAFKELLKLEAMSVAFNTVGQVEAGAVALEGQADFKDYLSRLSDFKASSAVFRAGLKEKKRNVVKLDKAYRRAISKSLGDRSTVPVSVARDAKSAAVADLEKFQSDAVLVLTAEFGAEAVKSNGLVQYFGLSL